MNSEKFEKKKKMEASGHVPIRGTVWKQAVMS